MCALSLSRFQHIQLKIYVLLSLEWSLHASSIQPLANWKSHLLTSLAFSGQINGSMNQWEGMNRLRLRGNGHSIHTRKHTHQIFIIDMWVTLSITPAVARQCGERNDFMSEKICSWIQLRLMVRDVDSFCSLAEGWAISLSLTSHWSRKLHGTAFITLNRLGDLIFLEDLWNFVSVKG